MTKLVVYVASPFGFSEGGRDYYSRVLLPALRVADLEVLDPWSESADGETMMLGDRLAHSERLAKLRELRELNRAIGSRNVGYLGRCDAVLAILDGADVDSGTASEIGYAAAIGRPVVGVRSDLRASGDNEATPVNLQVAHFIEQSGGALVRDLGEAVGVLTRLAARRDRDSRANVPEAE